MQQWELLSFCDMDRDQQLHTEISTKTELDFSTRRGSHFT